MLSRAQELGDATAAATLRSIEAEHDEIDPALAACEAGLATVTAHPCPAHRDRLDAGLTRTRAALLHHLRRFVPFLVGWGLEALPADAAAQMLTKAGPAYAVVHRLVRRSWERRERRTFRYA